MHKSSAPAGRIFVLCLLALLIFSTIAVACIYWRIYGYDKLFGDFATFQAAASHVLQGKFSAVYDADAAKRLFDAGKLKQFSYFLNPPTGLFIVLPLGFFQPIPGLLMWNAAQFLLLAAALNTCYIRRLFASAGAGAPTGALLAITCIAFGLQNILFGQVAVLCAGLFVLVLAWRGTRPVLAGIALGVFSFKPQLGILLPLLLLAEGNYKALLWAILTATAMIMLSISLWGTGLWMDYRNILMVRSEFLALNQSLLFVISISPYAAFRLMGLPAAGALCAQGLLAVALIALLWPIFKKGRESHKILVLTLATYFVTPYSFLYDMVLLALPAALMLRRTESGASTRSELIALLLVILMPLVALLLQIAHIPYSVIAIGFALGVARKSVNSFHEPGSP